MTVEHFIGHLQTYYGLEYSDGEKPYVLMYLRDIDPAILRELVAVTMKNFSRQYGKLPDIECWERLLPAAKAATVGRRTERVSVLPAPDEKPTDEEVESNSALIMSWIEMLTQQKTVRPESSAAATGGLS